MFLRIEGIPPGRIVFQPTGEPGHLGGEPFLLLRVVEDVVVLAFHLDEGNLTSEEFQGGKHLKAFYQRYVGIGITMQEQQRRMNLVGIKEG